jgi:acyl carrier protein
MADLESRLTKCFALAFPELDPREISSASTASLASWNSLAGITLIALVEEEFSLNISPDDIPDLISFDLILYYLRTVSSESA